MRHDRRRHGARARHVIVAADGALPALVPRAASRCAPGACTWSPPSRCPSALVDCPVYARWGYEYFQQLPGRARCWRAASATSTASASYTDRDDGSPAVWERIERYLRDDLGVDAPITHRWVGTRRLQRGRPAVRRAGAGQRGLYVGRRLLGPRQRARLPAGRSRRPWPTCVGRRSALAVLSCRNWRSSWICCWTSSASTGETPLPPSSSTRSAADADRRDRREHEQQREEGGHPPPAGGAPAPSRSSRRAAAEPAARRRLARRRRHVGGARHRPGRRGGVERVAWRRVVAEREAPRGVGRLAVQRRPRSPGPSRAPSGSARPGRARGRAGSPRRARGGTSGRNSVIGATGSCCCLSASSVSERVLVRQPPGQELVGADAERVDVRRRARPPRRAPARATGRRRCRARSRPG